MLFLRMATFLKTQNYDVAIVDYPDGDMANRCESLFPLIKYHDEREVVLPTNSIVILQAMTPWSIFPNLRVSPSSHIFFIATLPQNFFPLLPGKLRNIMAKGQTFAKVVWLSFLRSDYKKIKRFISLIHKKNALVFLDSDIVCNIQKSLGIVINNPKLLPLPGGESSENLFLKSHMIDYAKLNLGWVGRIADFKINILNKVLDDAFQYSQKYQQKIIFHIIGSGECEQRIKLFNSEHFTVKHIDYINPNDLSKYMLKLDMIFAMGTSALDSARIGVPTVRLDYSFSRVSDRYLYKMIDEVSGFCLGENIDGHCFTNGRHSFHDLMRVVKTNSIALSDRCFDYYNDNHSMQRGADMLINFVANSSLKWADLQGTDVLNSKTYSVWKKLQFNR